MKRLCFFLPSAACWLALTSCAPFGGNGPVPAGTIDDDAYRQLGIYAMAQELLREQYVDPSATGYDTLTANALKGMLEGLDPYSSYDSPEEFALTMCELQGEQIGIGAIVTKPEKAPLTVVATLPDTPAAEAGIRAGDRILAIDGTTTADCTLEDCLKQMRGEAESRIEVEIAGPADAGEEDPPPFRLLTLTRKRFHRNSIPDGRVRMLTPEIGYLHIESFTEATGGELDAALDRLNLSENQALVVDLRNNPGGVVEAAVAVCGRFLAPDSPVVTLEAADGRVLSAHRTGEMPPRFTGRVVVLINGASASAAEIVAGALHDQGRAELVGSTSYGKGTVQRIFELPNGGALRFSVARYFTPAHRLIDGVGIEPDIPAELDIAIERKLADQLLRDPAPDDLPDPQLEAACLAVSK